MNSDQSALLANLVALQNSLTASISQCDATTALVSAHFPAGSVPTVVADVTACRAALVAQLAEVTKSANLTREAINLA